MNQQPRFALPIQVSDPKKVSDRMSTYFTFTVSSMIDDSQRNVTRRYRDFLKLRDILKSKFPECIIPPLPDKYYVKTLTQKDVDARVRGLSSFINRVVKHKILSLSEELSEFLTMNDESFHEREISENEEKKFQDDAVDESFAGSMGKWLKGLVGLKGSFEYKKTEEDIKFEQRKASNIELVTLLNHCVQNVKELRRTGRDLSQIWFDTGISLSKLSTFANCSEKNEQFDLLKGFGSATDRIHVQTTKKIAIEEQEFEDPLEDIAKTAQAVQDVIDYRERYLHAYIDCLQRLESYKAELQYLREKNKVEKIQQSENLVNEVSQIECHPVMI
jgi:transcriptional regulator of heat shock response